MPQLMPLYWVFSMFMVCFVLFKLIDMYYNNINSVDYFNMEVLLNMKNYLW